MENPPSAASSTAERLDDLPTFGVALGRRLREVRTEQGRTAEDVAVYARALGMGWDRSTLARVEGGGRGVSAAELLLLPALYQLPLVELLPADRARLAEQVAVAPEALRDSLTRTPDVEGDGWTVTGHLEARVRASDVVKGVAAVRELAARFPDATLATLTRAEGHAGDDATGKAAKRLGVDRRVLAVAAERLWGRGLTEERDWRVAQHERPSDPRALQAARGHVTRTLLEQLRAVLITDQES